MKYVLSLSLALSLSACYQNSISDAPKGTAIGGQLNPVAGSQDAAADSQPSGAPAPAPALGAHGDPPKIEAPTPPANPPSFSAPAGWVSQTPESGMRAAQFTLPKADGDTQDATVVVFYFGENSGGSVEMNFQRWMGQIQQPDGKKTQDIAKTSVRSVKGVEIHEIDMSGLYDAPSMTGGPATRIENARFRGAVIMRQPGPYFIRFLGPQKTVEKWGDSFAKFLDQVAS